MKCDICYIPHIIIYLSGILYIILSLPTGDNIKKYIFVEEPYFILLVCLSCSNIFFAVVSCFNFDFDDDVDDDHHATKINNKKKFLTCIIGLYNLIISVFFMKYFISIFVVILFGLCYLKLISDNRIRNHQEETEVTNETTESPVIAIDNFGDIELGVPVGVIVNKNNDQNDNQKHKSENL
jgi:hypothetical protein